MSYSHYDRLTALDASFLSIEDHNAHMHVGSVGVFDPGPLQAAHGGLDMERVWAMSDTVLAHHPRFRQKLAYVPVFGNPVWVDLHDFVAAVESECKVLSEIAAHAPRMRLAHQGEPARAAARLRRPASAPAKRRSAARR